MSSRKDQEFKEFIISIRKKIGSGITNAPVWVMRKANKRIWNPKQKRDWKRADIGKLYKGRKAKRTKIRRNKEKGRRYKPKENRRKVRGKKK